MDQSQTLGEVIRTRRVALGLTQEELAERIGDGMRQAEVSRLERGRVTLPRRRRLERIAAALEVPLGRLLASAGWSDAEHAFFPSPRGVERVPAPATEWSTASVIVASELPMRSWNGSRSIDSARLQAAVEQSQSLLVRTEELIRQSQSLADSWYEGQTRHPPPRSA